MQETIKSRKEDVDFCQRHILEFEKSLEPENQVLTRFKIYQKIGKGNKVLNQPNIDKKLKDPRIIEILLEKGNGHTRKIIDELVPKCILIIWIALLSLSLYQMVSQL
ncbi:MAG: hypothetical protein JXR03_14775 [Cyclobacteriaceae bacterium]